MTLCVIFWTEALSRGEGEGFRKCCTRPSESPGPGLEAKVIPACHNDNKQTNLALLCRLEFFSHFYPLVDAA